MSQNPVQTGFRFALQRRYPVAQETTAFEFAAQDAADFSWRPGQCADFTLINSSLPGAEGSSHTFSIANSPRPKGVVMIATRMRASPFKKTLESMPLGASVQLSRPMGSFTLHKDVRRPGVFLAGGIGITPFRSMIEWVVEQRLSYPLTLFYSNHTLEAAPFWNDLEKWSRESRNFRFVPTLTRTSPPAWGYERGRIDPAMLKRHLPDMSVPIFYVAGPPGMVTSMKEALLASGADEDNVRAEEFYGY